MKTLIKTTALVIGLAPMAALANDWTPSEDDLQDVREALTTAGCTINSDETAAIVEAATDFTDEELETIVAQLRIYQEIVDASEQGGITLVSGSCAN